MSSQPAINAVTDTLPTGFFDTPVVAADPAVAAAIASELDRQQHQIGADDREVRHGFTFGSGWGRP
jgi:hypothetical protein